jgi:AsmA protein
MKRWQQITLAIVVLLLIVVVSLPAFLNVNAFRPHLEKQLTASLGRQVKLGKLSLSPLSGRLVANDLSVADDPAFSIVPFLTAIQLQIGIEMKSLIFSHQLRIRSFVLVNPQIHIVRGSHGVWNFSNLGSAAQSSPASTPLATDFAYITVGVFTIRDGQARVESSYEPGQKWIYNHLDLTVSGFSASRPFPFTASATIPGDCSVSATGSAGPLNQLDTATTPFDAQLTIKKFDPIIAGFLDPAVGLSLLADVDAHAKSDGSVLSSNGTVHIQRLQLHKGGTPVPNPVNLNYTLTHTLKDNTGEVREATLTTGKVALHVSGTDQLLPDGPKLNLKLAGQSMPIDELQSLLNAAGVRLPHGSVMKGGTMTVALSVVGPAKSPVVSGPVELENTHLVGFNLGERISGIAAMGGVKTGDTTSIEHLRMNLHATDALIKVEDLNAVIGAIGVLTGHGTITPPGVLDFQLHAQLTSAQGFGKVGAGLLSKLNFGSKPKEEKAEAKGVPLTVTGTPDEPVITADMKGILNGDKNAILGVFGKKK